jgi:hypothetical protein
MMTEPGVLTMAAPEVTVAATGKDVVIVLGQTADVEAWVGRDAHTTVTGLADWHVLATNDVGARPEPAGPGAEEPAPPDGEEATVQPTAPAEDRLTEEPAAPAEGEETQDGTEEPDGEQIPALPDPRGSDMWWAEVSGSTSAELEWTQTDGRWSVLVAATGVGAGPPGITLTWPQEVVTPWLLPGVFLGSLLLMIGLAWWALILVAARRHARGAARVVPLPASEPAALPAAPLTRRQLREAADSRELRRRRPQERNTIVERFPMLVPTPRTVTPPSQEALEGTTPGETGVGVASLPEATPSAGERATRRGFAPRLLRRGGKRRGSTPDEGSAHGDAQQPRPPSAAGAPAASADAWRRTWGLPDTDDKPESSPDGVRR